MSKTETLPIPHYCRYEGQLKVKHTALPTPHTSLADYKQFRDKLQFKAQLKSVAK